MRLSLLDHISQVPDDTFRSISHFRKKKSFQNPIRIPKFGKINDKNLLPSQHISFIRLKKNIVRLLPSFARVTKKAHICHRRIASFVT